MELERPLAFGTKADAVTPDSKPAAPGCSPGTACSDKDMADDNTPESPVCPLTQAALALSAATTAKSSTDVSGSSVVAPTAVVDSIAAVAALRRGHLRYRSACAPAAAPHRTQLYLKLPNVEPEQLRPCFMADVNESLRTHGSGLRVVGAYVRRGCVELTLDLLDRRGPTQAADSEPISELDISALILSALGAPPAPPPLECSVADGGAGQGSQAVLVQRGDACWAVQWDADTMQWQMCGQDGGLPPSGDADAVAGDNSGEGGVDGAVILSAPAAVHAPVQLTAGAEAAGRRLRLALVVHGSMDFTSAATASPSVSGQQQQPVIIAKANGRTVVTPVVQVTTCGASVGTRCPGTATTMTAAPETSMVQIELDLGQLAAGRPASSHGLVVRLELWRGSRCVARCALAALRQDALVSELLELQRDITSAGELDPEDDAYLTPAAQREELEQLLGDLSSWLDYVAAVSSLVNAPGSATARVSMETYEGRGSHERGSRDALDLSGQVGWLLQQPDMQATLLSAGQNLLEHFVYKGHVALARSVYGDLAPLAARAAAAGCADAITVAAALAAPRDAAGGGAQTGRRKTLLHRAVRSGSKAMVQQVLQWYGTSTATGAVGVAAWGARGPGGVTPLHLLVADARCGCAAAGPAATDDSDALLRWVIGTFPAAVTVWNTARDASGNTPSRLWSALGGPNIQLQAVAAALEEAVTGTTRLEPASSPASSAAAAANAPDAKAAATAGAAAAEAALLASPPTGVRGLLRLCLSGFPSRVLEARYVEYVTHTTAASTSIWVVVMVLAHTAAFTKSLSTGEAQQAAIGGVAYVVSLALMVGLPRLYARLREHLMLSCLLGRTIARLLMATLPDSFRMSDSVTKYILYSLDILLDGLLEGTFEQVRVTRAAAGRLLEAPITAAFMTTHGVRPSFGAALLRAAAISGAGLAMSALTDMRLRSSFLRALRSGKGEGGGVGVGGGVGGGHVSQIGDGKKSKCE